MNVAFASPVVVATNVAMRLGFSHHAEAPRHRLGLTGGFCAFLARPEPSIERVSASLAETSPVRAGSPSRPHALLGEGRPGRAQTVTGTRLGDMPGPGARPIPEPAMTTLTADVDGKALDWSCVHVLGPILASASVSGKALRRDQTVEVDPTPTSALADHLSFGDPQLAQGTQGAVTSPHGAGHSFQHCHTIYGTPRDLRRLSENPQQ